MGPAESLWHSELDQRHLGNRPIFLTLGWTAQSCILCHVRDSVDGMMLEIKLEKAATTATLAPRASHAWYRIQAPFVPLILFKFPPTGIKKTVLMVVSPLWRGLSILATSHRPNQSTGSRVSSRRHASWSGFAPTVSCLETAFTPSGLSRHHQGRTMVMFRG